MDRPFIKLMCESYYNDLQLYNYDILKNKEKTILEMCDELNTLMENVKLEDEYLYYEIHNELDRISHKGISYYLISDYLQSKYHLFEAIDDHFRTEYDSAEQCLLEIGGASLGTDFIGNVLGVGASLSSVPAAGAAASTFSLGVLGTGALTILGMVWLWKGLSRAGWKTLTALNDANKVIAEKIHNMTRSGKVKQAIFLNNVDSCWKKCGLNPNEISRFVGFVLSGKYIISGQAEREVNCLTICYLNWTLQQVAALCQGYVKCLEATGERDVQLNDLNVFLHEPAGSDCKHYYDILKKHYEDYIDAIEVIFKFDRDILENYKRKYHQVLHDNLSTFNRPKVGHLENPSLRSSNQSPRQSYQNNQRR